MPTYDPKATEKAFNDANAEIVRRGGQAVSAAGTGLTAPPPSQSVSDPEKFRQFSIGLANGTIKNQADTNAVFGNESYGSAVPDAAGSNASKPNRPVTQPPPQTQQQLDQASGDNNPYGYNFKGERVANPNPINRSIQQNSVAGASNTTSAVGGGGGTSTDQYQSDAERYLNTFVAPKTEAQILEEKTAQARDLISAKKDYYQSLTDQQAPINEQRSREANAQAVLNGLSGSTAAGEMAVKASTDNKRANDTIAAQKAQDLASTYLDIQNQAHEEAIQAQKDARTQAEGIVTRTAEQRQKGLDNVKMLASSGVDLAKIAKEDPTTYQHLVESAGGERELQAMFTLNRPQEDIIDKKIESGKYIIAYRNPLTGATRIESIDLGIPPNYSKSVDLGDRMMFLPDGFNPQDPNSPQPMYVSKGLTQEDNLRNELLSAQINSTNALANQRSAGGGGSELTPYQQFQATQSIAKDTVARTANAREISRQATIMNDAYKSFTSGGDKNIATQQIITTFNKILDPTSVVRESEFDRTAAGQALIAKIQGKYENIAQGGLGVTPETLRGAVDAANQYMEGAKKSIDAENQRARNMATQFGLNPDFVSTPTPYGGDTPDVPPAQHQFSDIESSLSKSADGKNLYIPKSVWSTLGARKDALIAEAKKDGLTLLVK